MVVGHASTPCPLPSSNFMLDPLWLFSTMPSLLTADTLAIAVGDPRSKAAVDAALPALPARVKAAVQPPVERYGTHHSKFFLLGYEAGLRVIVVVSKGGRGGRVRGAPAFRAATLLLRLRRSFWTASFPDRARSSTAGRPCRRPTAGRPNQATRRAPA